MNLGIGLVREGKKVLLIDIDADSQGSLSSSLGVEEPLELKYDGFDENFEAVVLSLQS